MIIDVHSHLGDILNKDGGSLIGRKGVVKEISFDPISIGEAGLMRTYGLGSVPYAPIRYFVTRAERARNATATLENMGRSMDEAGVSYTACMPIAPYVTFEDLEQARKKDKRVLPFTTVDFSAMKSVSKKLAQDVRRGALGLKLHPIIQSIPLNDSRVMEALQAFAPLKKPVLTHAGVSNYYHWRERTRNVPEFGKIKHIEDMVRSFPGISFIVGHSGLFQWADVIRKLRGCRNVWMDTSFQSPHKIRKLIRTFGADKVMYASDWPYGNRTPAIRTVRLACRGDKKLEERILGGNAKELLGVKA